jgi:hypothetical protein
MSRATRPFVTYQANIKKPPKGDFLMSARCWLVSRLDGLEFK